MSQWTELTRMITITGYSYVQYLHMWRKSMMGLRCGICSKMARRCRCEGFNYHEGEKVTWFDFKKRMLANAVCCAWWSPTFGRDPEDDRAILSQFSVRLCHHERHDISPWRHPRSSRSTPASRNHKFHSKQTVEGTRTLWLFAYHDLVLGERHSEIVMTWVKY